MRPSRATETIALIDPVGDAGIGGYTHELAQGLVSAGAHVDVYAPASAFARTLPRSYALLPILRTPPHEWADAIRDAATSPAEASCDVPCALAPYLDRLRPRSAVRPTPVTIAPNAAHVPASALSHEARVERADALHTLIGARDTTLVWTQWPDVGEYGDDFRARCRDVGLPVAHTVHNVMPHEHSDDAMRQHDAAYSESDVLVVHSAHAARELAARCTDAAERTVVSRHGVYTTYPRRPAARAIVRERLAIDDAYVVLAFGGVRPYKNVDALLEAVARTPHVDGRRVVLVIAGWEWGYDMAVPNDRLGRTRWLVESLGITDRVRLLPGPFGTPQAAELFEAADAVALPYRDGSGSGVLCLAMTFGRHVLITQTGGMMEHVEGYGACTVLADGSAAGIADGLVRAARCGSVVDAVPPAALAWTAIAARALRDVREVVCRQTSGVGSAESS